MVRGNWQKRVERTEARRQEAKQVKQKKQDRRQSKLQAQRLLNLLDKYGSRPLRLHVWSDAITNAQLVGVNGDTEDDGGGGSKKKKGRPRSNSQSNAGDHANSTKKIHPRSKEAMSTTTPEDDEPTPLACRSQFFQDKCAHKKACRSLHYNDPFKTLACIIKNPQILQRAELAAMEALGDDVLEAEPHAMELLHYMCLDLSISEDVSLSDDIVHQLSQCDIKMADLVYVVANDSLIYDRCRDGIFLDEKEVVYAINGQDEMGKRKISIGSSEVDAAGTLTKLPGSILEHTLTFLPDTSVRACSMVCTDWHSEIGKASPHLWRHLLERRNWPFPDGKDQSQEQFRKTFVDHYTAMRNMNAVKQSMMALTTRKALPECEMCYQDFSTRKQAPSEPNACIAVQVWSPNRILAAYSQDCSIRLFEAVPKSAHEKLCKELVCQWFDPYRKTKRRRCTLLSMVLDDDCIGTLCHVNADEEDAEADILVLVDREDFLLGDSSAALEKGSQVEELELNVIDVGEATINYLLSTDIADHRLLQLMDFLQDGGDIGEIEILASRTMVACGNRRFMVEVCISIPSDDADEEDERPMRLIDRKLVLFSESVGAIVWIGNSGNPLVEPQPRGIEASMTELRRILPGDYNPTSNVLVASSFSPDIWLVTIEPSGSVKPPMLVEGSIPVGSDTRIDGWIISAKPQRHILLTESCGIAVDLLQKHAAEGVFERKSVLSFYPISQPGECSDASYQVMELHSCEILRMINLQDTHIGLVCREYEDFIQVEMNEGIRMSLLPQSVCFIIVHIPSKTEIYRTAVGCIDSFEDDMSDVPILSVYNNTTIGCALDWRGISISGDDVRHMNMSYVKTEASHPNSAKKKKKKQGGIAKGRRKDGFARGMSLRG